jgi:transposase
MTRCFVDYTKSWEKKIGKNEQPSLVILDSQAVKNTDCASETWFCHYKCVNWIKRHILVDVLWIPVCLLVTTANISDQEGWKKLWEINKDILKWIRDMLADNWYASEKFKVNFKENTWITVTVTPKPTKDPANPWFKPDNKRWVVERTNSWAEKCRRLHKNNERLLTTSEAMLKLCFIRLILRRLWWRWQSWKWAKKI